MGGGLARPDRPCLARIGTARLVRGARGAESIGSSPFSPKCADGRSTMPTERRRVWYEGRVQGVGFRYTARGLAGGFPVSGYVRNLDDGRVELVAEGDAPVVSS